MKALVKEYTGMTGETQDSLRYVPIYENFSEEEYEDEYPQFIEKNQEDGYKGEVAPLKISELERIISIIKEEGATHVEIMYHGDHDSYCLSGLKIYKASKEEVEESIKSENESKLKLEQSNREKLLKMLEESENKIKKLSK